jgi:hypothetical protein
LRAFKAKSPYAYLTKYRAGSPPRRQADFILFRYLFSRHKRRTRVDRQSEGAGMAGRTVVVRLNQQQIELLDRTIQRGEATDRVALIRKALREQAAKQRNGGAR